MTSPRRISVRPRTGAFTLIEILSVLAVITILIGFAAPSFFSSQLSQTLSSTASTLKGTLDQARSLAIQKRTYTRVLIPTKPIPILESRLDRNLALTSYTVAVWDRNTSTWSIDDIWRSLPEALAFEPADAPSSLPITDQEGAGVISSNTRTIEDIDLDGDSATDPFEAAIITFQADGSCSPTGTSGESVTSWLLAIAEGDVTPSGTFERRRSQSFRALILTCTSGAIAEDVPAP